MKLETSRVVQILMSSAPLLTKNEQVAGVEGTVLCSGIEKVSVLTVDEVNTGNFHNVKLKARCVTVVGLDYTVPFLLHWRTLKMNDICMKQHFETQKYSALCDSI